MIKFYNERLDLKLFEELIPILKASRDEVYSIKQDTSLSDSMVLESLENNNVNYNHYLQKQNEGLLHISTIRDNGKLVGHWTLLLTFHGQSKNFLIANCENLHIIKEYRKDNNSKNFMSFVENELKKRGVKQIYFGVNPQLKTDILLKRLGWTLNEVILTKGL